jgi:hypothetical protein
MGSIKQLHAIELNAIRNLGRAAGLLYILIDIVSLIPADSSPTATAWLAPGSVLEGLVGRVEVLGGLWILLVTWGALRAGKLPRVLHYLGLAAGVAGIATAVPALAVLGVGFRVGEMVWGVWLGIAMLRNSPNAAARKLVEFVAVRCFAVREVLRGPAGRRLSAGVPAGQRGEADAKP